MVDPAEVRKSLEMGVPAETIAKFLGNRYRVKRGPHTGRLIKVWGLRPGEAGLLVKAVVIGDKTQAAIGLAFTTNTLAILRFYEFVPGVDES